jgi:hypothetical protein
MAKKIKGLGDVVKTVTDAVGVEQCPKCKQKQSWLNVNFAFNRPKPLTDEQKEMLKPKYSTENGISILTEEPNYLQVYNEAFNQDVQPEQFTGGVQKAILKKLNQLLNYDDK